MSQPPAPLDSPLPAIIHAEQLRILVVSDAAPSRNGVGAYYLDLIEQLQKSVHTVELVSPTIVDGQWQAGLVLPMPGDKTQKVCVPNYWKLRKRIKQLKPDLIVVATPGVYGLCAAHLAKHQGIPFFTGFHTSFEHLTELYWPNSIRGKIVEKYFLVCNRYLFNRTEAVLGNSDSILDQAKAMGAHNTELIGTPLASDFLNPEPLPHPGSFQSLLFAGRLAKEKNIEAILEAAESCPEINFSIAGDGPMRDTVIEACSEHSNLCYLGWLSREDLREAIDKHDGLILPSHYETFGTIALEAMARRKIVIVSSGCGISLWPEFSKGLIVFPENESMTNCLKQWSQKEKSELISIAEEAYKAASNLNTQVIQHWIELIQHTVQAFTAKRNP